MTLYTEILPNLFEDITSTLYSGNAFYHLVQNIFFFSFLSKKYED